MQQEEIDKLVNYKINEAIEKFSTVLEKKLVQTLSGKIENTVKPLSATREDYLSDELARANVILTEINNSWLGWLLLKRIEKKLRKKQIKEA